MAEDDFKECAEGGKHIAMGRDVLDRIERHYDRVIEFLGPGYACSIPVSFGLPVRMEETEEIVCRNVLVMDSGDCRPQRDGYFCVEHGITFIASCAMCEADVNILAAETSTPLLLSSVIRWSDGNAEIIGPQDDIMAAIRDVARGG